MMNSKITATTAILTLSIASIALIYGLSETEEITAADVPAGNGMYPFAEDVNPVATFKFKDATVAYPFQTLTQVSGFGGGRGVTPEFTMQKIPGDTPYLHQALVEAHAYGRYNANSAYKEFDITVDLVRQGKDILTLEYQRCNISNHKIVTEFDKAESFTGKDAFAVLEQYTFTCNGYGIDSPLYKEMTTPVQP